MTLRIGTRGSQLAMTQTRWVEARLHELEPGLRSSLQVIKTRGDRIQDVALHQVGGKGLFVREIETALLAGEIDCAVHSLKDLPAEQPQGLAVAAIPARAPAVDVLVLAQPPAECGQGVPLPQAARVGTSSLRRQAQLRHARPDLTMVELRGNLDTRIRKLVRENLDAVVLARAGLHRMGWEDGGQFEEVAAIVDLSPDVCLPAAGQGALAIECRADDAATVALLQRMDDAATRAAVTAERAVLAGLDAGCQAPLGAYARVIDGRLQLAAMLADPAGERVLRTAAGGESADAETIGVHAVEDLLALGAQQILNAVRSVAG